jgi:hypothetical protein
MSRKPLAMLNKTLNQHGAEAAGSSPRVIAGFHNVVKSHQNTLRQLFETCFAVLFIGLI